MARSVISGARSCFTCRPSPASSIATTTCWTPCGTCSTSPRRAAAISNPSSTIAQLPEAERHDTDRVAWAALDDAIGIDEVDESPAFGVPEARHLGRLEDQRGALAEHLVCAPELGDLAL